MERRVACHQSLDTNDVVGVDGLLELPDLLGRFDVSLSFGQLANP